MGAETLAEIESRMNIYNLCYWYLNLSGGEGLEHKSGVPVDTIAIPRRNTKEKQMKRKMVEINKCLECPYQGGVDMCGNPNLGFDIKDFEKIPDLDTIPDWCPLQDKLFPTVGDMPQVLLDKAEEDEKLKEGEDGE